MESCPLDAERLPLDRSVSLSLATGNEGEKSGASAFPGVRVAAMSVGWNFPEGEDIDSWMSEVESAGYDGVSGFAESWPEYLDAPSRFRAMLDRHGLELASVDVALSLSFDELRRVCAFMAETGCTHLVCLGGFSRNRDDLRITAEVMNHLGEIAREHGVRPVYHNHTDTVGETFEDVTELIRQLDPALVGLMLDTGHATKDFVEFPVDQRAVRFLEAYGADLEFVEFKDWNRITDLNTPVGEGMCNWGKIFELLRSSGYDGWVTVEQNGNEGPSLGRTPLECARVSREFIRDEMGI